MNSSISVEQKNIFTYIICTVDFQRLKHLLNHENMFETGVVRANECYSGKEA